MVTLYPLAMLMFGSAVMAASARAAPPSPGGVPDAAGGTVLGLLADPGFENGIVVMDPAPGRHVERSRLRPWPDRPEASWRLSPWYSRFHLEDAPRELLPDGSVRFADGSKAVTFLVRGAERRGLALALDGIAEYGGKAPAKGEPWPHMLLNQRLLVHPALTELRAVPFRIRYRLVRAVARQGPGWDPRRHTAQFVFYVTLQNLTRGSEGYGDYLYFGALLYDLRFPMPPPFAALDRGTAKKQGTGKFIFQPAFARLSDRSPHDGQPVEIDIDLLPMLEEAIEEAWRRGYLAGSRQRGDYRLSGMNMGWETTGPVDAELEIEHLFLEARTIPPPG